MLVWYYTIQTTDRFFILDFIDGEIVTKTFTNFSTDTEQTFQFTIINDEIVELKEHFGLIITASDPRVIIMEPLLLFSINDDESTCYMA